MATAEPLNHAKAFLRKAEEYLASAEDNLVAERYTAAAGAAEKALRELISAKRDVEYGPALLTAMNAEPLVRRARFLLELAAQIVRLGG
ncbi:MAG: hypothetical protein OEU98_05095 [Actinomycetota bacterium]|nr:hypothetical protein [Actinomycetota bacterium]